jgi:ATP-dependent helicase/DNAse subunit B
MSITLDNYELPPHVSYSAFTTYLTCGYQYYLGRLLKLEEEPSIWSAGGRAFHHAAELWDLENL